MSFLDNVKWDIDGLVPVVAQDNASGRVLMVAWMSRTALQKTAETGVAVYWSRSRKQLWKKGEESGHVQLVKQIRLDCDADVIILKVVQQGSIACHTGRESCFYRVLNNGVWDVVDPILKDPSLIYGKHNQRF